MPIRQPIAVPLATLGLLAAGLPAQAGLIEVFWGPAWMEAEARSEYVHFISDPFIVEQVAPQRTVTPSVFPDFPAGGVFESVAATSLRTSSLPGGSSGPKDTADGRVVVRYTVGTASGGDNFRFEFSGLVSNEESYVSAGKQASFASVRLRGAVVVEISPNSTDRTGYGIGDRVGSLTLRPLRAATPYESFSVQVSTFYAPGSGLLLRQIPDSPAASIDLHVGERYTVQLDYLMQVPFGIDPPFSLDVGGSISAVPEPAPTALLAAGLLALALRRRGLRAG